jgi:DNA-binding LacI/PurR family transcriptional regulator
VPHSPSRKVSSKDVAEAAGVSRTTVSFVLNDRPNSSIPDDTRKRVLAAAQELGYTPSPEARALKFGRSAVVLCLLPDWPITGPLGVLLENLSADLAASGLTMLAHQRSPGDELSRVLGALTPTAIVAMCDLSEAEVQFAEGRDIPLMAFMGKVPGRPDVAHLRQSDIGRLQVTALLERGHTSLAYVLPHDRQLDWFSAPRLEGAQEEAARAGAELRHYRASEDDEAELADWIASATRDEVTAVCAYNDEVAFSVLMAARDAKVSVPDDLSVIGVDDSFIARITRPALSTIGFGLADEARRLAALVTSDAEPADVAPAEILQLHVRDSVRSF